MTNRFLHSTQKIGSLVCPFRFHGSFNLQKLILSKKLEPTNIYIKVEKYGGGGISHLGYFRLENAGVDIHTEG